MEIQIESTDELTLLDGVPCRVWKGVTAAGTNCLVFVHRVMAADAEDFDQLAREGHLQEMPPPNLEPVPKLLR